MQRWFEKRVRGLPAYGGAGGDQGFEDSRGQVKKLIKAP